MSKNTHTKAIPAAIKAKRHAHAKAALEEAKSRRDKINVATKNSKTEKNGRGGLDPARYGDWEIKGITSDF